MDDGRIGHAEIGIGDAALMLSDPFPDIGVEAPTAASFSHSLHLQVADVDATVRRAEAGGATIEREPADEPYGRVASLVDPFGHRWMLNQPPPGASRLRDGDVGYITLQRPRRRAGHGVLRRGARLAVHARQRRPGLERRGRHPDGRHRRRRRPSPSAQLCYKVSDIDAGGRPGPGHGGRAGEPGQQAVRPARRVHRRSGHHVLPLATAEPVSVERLPCDPAGAGSGSRPEVKRLRGGHPHRPEGALVESPPDDALRPGGVHLRGIRRAAALLHEPRRAGVRPRQPARGGEGRAVRRGTAGARRACAGCSSTSSSATSTSPATTRSTPPSA